MMAKTPEELDRIINFVRNDGERTDKTQKLKDDLLIHGIAITKNGERIPPDQVFILLTRTDTELLDWCEKNHPEISCSPNEKYFNLFCGTIWKQGPTYRGVINQAMQMQNKMSPKVSTEK